MFSGGQPETSLIILHAERERNARYALAEDFWGWMELLTGGTEVCCAAHARVRDYFVAGAILSLFGCLAMIMSLTLS